MYLSISAEQEMKVRRIIAGAPLTVQSSFRRHRCSLAQRSQPMSLIQDNRPYSPLRGNRSNSNNSRNNREVCGRRIPFPILHISSFTFHYCFFYSSVPTSVDIFITPLSRVSALLFIYLYSLYFSSKYTAMCLCILYTIFEQEFYRGTKNFTYYLSYFCYLYSP